MNSNSPNFHDRLSLILEKEESIAGFARKAGVSEGTIRSYLRAGTLPKIDNAAAIAEAAGVSLDWLWFGETEAMLPENEELHLDHLILAIQFIEDWLTKHKRSISVNNKARMISKLYEIILEDEKLGLGTIDEHRVNQILKLVS